MHGIDSTDFELVCFSREDAITMPLMGDRPADVTQDRYSVVIPILFFLVGFVGYSLRVIDYFEAVPGDIGDTRFNSVIFEHIYLWVVGLHSNLWSPDFFYPNTGALAFSENHFGTAIFYVPFRMVGFSREISVDCWFLIGFLLNYLSCLYCLRKLQFDRLSGAAGAFVFTFALPMLHQEGHIQLLYRFAVPLAVLALIHAWDARRITELWKTAVWVCVQFFCTIYIGVFLLYLLAAIFIGLVAVDGPRTLPIFARSLRQETTRRILFSSGLAAVSLSAMACLLYQYVAVAGEYAFSRPIASIKSMLPRIGSYFLNDSHPYTSVFGSWFQGIPMRHEHQMFVGVAVLCLVGVGAAISLLNGAAHFSRIGRVAICSIAIIFLATLDINGVSVYELVANAPGINSVRAVSRIILVLLFPLAILTAIGIDTIAATAARKSLYWRVPAVLGVTILIGFETVTYPGKSSSIAAWRDRQENVLNALSAALKDDSILWVRADTTSASVPVTSLDAMVFAQDHRIPTFNGYSGYSPPYTLPPVACMTPAVLLASWARFSKMTPDEQSRLARRAVVASLSPCLTREFRMRTSPLEEEIATNLALSLSRFAIRGNKIVTTVTISNNSQRTLDTLAADGRDIRLSWRVVHLDGGEKADPGWNKRKALMMSVAEGASEDVDIEAAAPSKPGAYVLEVTLVEEMVRWLHKGAIVPARIEFSIPVR